MTQHSPTLRPRRASITGLLLVVLLAIPAAARASCNLIPVAQKQYPSALGGVENPITSPGKTVTLRVTPCDASPGFEPVAADNDVELRFEPPGTGADTTVAIDSGTVTVSDCTLPGGRCTTLKFLAPDTTTELPPYGLAGPAHIIVRDTATDVVADISSLSLPALSCDRTPETVFKQFTVLPQPNSYADAVNGSLTELRETVDAGGDLLVPFDYWGGGTNSVLAETPGAPVAIFLQGSGDIPAMGAGDTNTILGVVSQQTSPSSFIRSFTLDGRPLPPLLRLTTTGELLGSADAVESVLRIARNDGNGGPDLYDLSDRLFMDRGPIIVTSFTATRKSPIPLNSIRSSSQTVSFARDESREGNNLNGDSDNADLVMQILNAEDGTTTNTHEAVARLSSPIQLNHIGFGLTETVPWTAAAAVAAGELVAFIESERDQSQDINSDLDFEDAFLRVYRRDGTDLTAATIAAAAPVSVIDKHPLAISGSRVFFRSPHPLLEVQEDGVNGVDGLSSIDAVVVSPDGKNVYAASSGDGAVAVFARDVLTGHLSFVESDVVAAGAPAALAVSLDGKHVYVTGAAGNALIVYARNSLTGALTFVEQHVDGSSGVNGLAGAQGVTVSPDGANVYAAGHDDDAVAVFGRDSLTGHLTFVEAEIQAFTKPVAVVVSPNGANVYSVGGVGSGMETYVRAPGNGSLSLLDGGSAQYAFVAISPDGRFLYVAGDGEDVFALTPAPSTFVQGLNVVGLAGRAISMTSDGTRCYIASTDSVYAFDRNPETGKLTFIGAYFNGQSGFRGLGGSNSVAVSPDGLSLYVAGETDDAIAVFTNDSDIRAFDADAQALRSSSVPATVAAVYGERTAVLTSEALTGQDLNQDGDELDEGVQFYDASGATDVVLSLGISASHVALSDQIVAMMVPEANEGNVDLTFDGDTDDDELVIYDIARGKFDFTGLAADEITVMGTTVVFLVNEDSGAHMELNGDGDMMDDVVRLYDADHHRVVDTGQTALDFATKDELVAFRTDEDAQAADIDGDSSALNAVLQIYDPRTQELLHASEPTDRCYVPGCDPLTPYSIDPVHGTVSFLTAETNPETAYSADLNGDGDTGDVVLEVESLRGHFGQAIATVQNDTDPNPDESLQQALPPFPTPFLTDDVLFHRARESEIGVDVNEDGVIDDAIVTLVGGDSDGDGLYDDFDKCVEASNPDGLDVDADDLGDSRCDPDPSACPPAPLIGCRLSAPGASGISMKNDDDDSKDAVSWKWTKGEATSVGEFGDPLAGVAHYSLCVYDGSANPQPVFSAAAVAQTACGEKPCWKATGTKGFGYKDKTGHLTGTQLVKLGAGETLKSKILFKAKGTQVNGPNLPISVPVTVQVVLNNRQEQTCWEATYSTSTKSDATQFKAKSD